MSGRRQYPFHLIEPKWQQHWDDQQTFRAWNPGEVLPQAAVASAAEVRSARVLTRMVVRTFRRKSEVTRDKSRTVMIPPQGSQAGVVRGA